MSDLQGFTIILCGVALYFLPCIVGTARKVKAGNGITIVNLFLGWTFVGWVVALAWAACGEVQMVGAFAGNGPDRVFGESSETLKPQNGTTIYHDGRGNAYNPITKQVVPLASLSYDPRFWTLTRIDQ